MSYEYNVLVKLIFTVCDTNYVHSFNTAIGYRSMVIGVIGTTIVPINFKKLLFNDKIISTAYVSLLENLILPSCRLPIALAICTTVLQIAPLIGTTVVRISGVIGTTVVRIASATIGSHLHH